MEPSRQCIERGRNREAETTADKNSYGFREGRSCADAVQVAFNFLSKPNSATYVLEADIDGCFDNIAKEWMMDNIPMDKIILRKWLEAGHIESNIRYPTLKGTPQGIISPTIANMALDGLEQIKIKAEANPYLPEFSDYYWRRRNVKEARLLGALSHRQYKAMIATR